MSNKKKIVMSLEARTGMFNDGMKKLMEEFGMGIGAVAQLTPDGRITASPVLVDALENRNLDTPSVGSSLATE